MISTLIVGVDIRTYNKGRYKPRGVIERFEIIFSEVNKWFVLHLSDLKSA